MPDQPSSGESSPDPVSEGMSRRSFLRTSAVFGTGLAALAAGLTPLLDIENFPSLQEFMQKYYKEMTPEEMKKVLERIEREVEKQYGIRPHVRDLKPLDGVEYVYCLNLTRCIGCRKCVHACHLAGARRDHGHRLQLVHRVPVLRGGLPLLGETFQLHQALDPGRPAQP